MAQFNIEFDVHNEAFHNEAQLLDLDTVADALTSVARQLRAGRTDGPVFDFGGNTIGTFTITDDA